MRPGPELVTLRVGIPKANGEVTGLTVDFLVERTALCKRWVERATRDLVNAGIIRVNPVAKRDTDGNYSGKGGHSDGDANPIRGIRPRRLAQARARPGRSQTAQAPHAHDETGHGPP